MNTNKKVNEVLGKRIKETRKAKNITREHLAEKIDVSTRFLAEVEAGKTGVSLNTLKNLCEVLCVSSDFLLGIEEFTEEETQYLEIEKKIRKIDKNNLLHFLKIIDAFYDATSNNK